MPENIFDRLKAIKAFVFDVDGVMTDGQLLLLDNGEWLRQMNIKDGFALKYAVEKRYKIGVISGSGSEAIAYRLRALGIEDVHLMVENKIAAFEKFVLKHGISAAEVLYMGDDIPDIQPMKSCGLAACPQDAVAEIKKIAHYITGAAGGKGCVREVIEMVLKLHNQWNF